MASFKRSWSADSTPDVSLRTCWRACATCWCSPWAVSVRKACCLTTPRPRTWTICIARAASLGLAALTQMADTINATLANMTGAISPRMRLELLAARLLAGRETGVVAQAAAPSSGMPGSWAAGGAAASESQRPSVPVGTPRNRHVEGMPWNRPRLPRIRRCRRFRSGLRIGGSPAGDGWTSVGRQRAGRFSESKRLKRSLRHPNYPMPKLPLPPSPWLSPQPQPAGNGRSYSRPEVGRDRCRPA